MRNQSETHQTVPEPQPGDGVEVSAARARQGYNGPVSRRILWVLIVSFVLSLAAMGGYWASISDDLDRGDKHGQPIASGRKVTDPKLVALFHAPEPAPKQPPVDQIARSSAGGGAVGGS
jgi:hypothetical protein